MPAKPAKEQWTGTNVTKARAYWRMRLPLPCYLCGRPVVAEDKWVVEHMVPRSAGGSVLAVSNQFVSHRKCSDRSGGKITRAKQLAAKKAKWLDSAQSRNLRGV